MLKRDEAKKATSIVGWRAGADVAGAGRDFVNSARNVAASGRQGFANAYTLFKGTLTGSQQEMKHFIANWFITCLFGNRSNKLARRILLLPDCVQCFML